MFASLQLPQFRLQAALRWRDDRGAAVVVDDASLVLEADAAAQRKGIHADMTSAQAMARDLRVRILNQSAAQEDALNHLLIGTAQSLSAEVELTAGGMCVADLRRRPAPPCWQTFGDELVARFDQEKLRAVVGFAPTPDLALLAAQGGASVGIIYDAAAFVAPLPISALHPSPELEQTLRDWGIVTVGNLLALPKSSVIDRLGAEAEALLHKVSGRHKRPLRLVRPIVRYVEAFDFEHEIDTTEPLLFLLRRFLDSLSERLRAAHQVARKLRLRLPLENGDEYTRVFTIPAPTTDIVVLHRILDTHLESLRLEHRPVGLRLEIEPAKTSGSQLGLFETALRDLNGFGETLARLKALLGDGRVGVPRKLDTHRPDAFALDDHFPENPVSTSEESPRGFPLRRFRPAVGATVEERNGHPAQLRSARASGAVIEWAGPFRSSGDWWDTRSWGVEEWDVELETGGMFRISRHGPKWRLEGAYELLR